MNKTFTQLRYESIFVRCNPALTITLLLFMLLLQVNTASAQTDVYTNTFTNPTDAARVTSTFNRGSVAISSGASGQIQITGNNGSNAGYNGYIITAPAILAAPGIQYTVKVKARVNATDRVGTLEIRRGSNAAQAGSTSGVTILAPSSVTSTNFNEFTSGSFTLNSNEDLYIGLHVSYTGNNNAVFFIDDISITATCSQNSTFAAAITTSTPTIFCQNGSVLLTANPSNPGTGRFTYQWRNGSTNINGAINATYSATTSGEYSVVITNAGLCSATSAATTVTVNPLPAAPTIAPTSVTTICSGGTAALTATGTTGGSYNWYTTPTGGTAINTNLSGQNNSTYSPILTNNTATPTTTTYYVEAVNPSGQGSCVSSTRTRVDVTVNPLPVKPAILVTGATTFCAGETVILTAPLSSSYLWSNGATTREISVSTSGNYSVQVGNSNGCLSVSSDAIPVVVNSLPATPTITSSRAPVNGAVNLCAGETVRLTASAGSSYLWSNKSNTQTFTTQFIDVSTPGNYTVQVYNENGCFSTSAAMPVNVNALPEAIIAANGPTTFCQGGTVRLTASAGTSWLWSNEANSQTFTTQFIDVTASGTYTVKVTDSNGCFATSGSVTVTVNPLPEPTIEAGGATTFCQGGSVILTASEGSLYEWSNGETTRSITVSTSGNYSVQVTNANGCFATSAATTVTVNPLPTASITANGPTNFCPGGSITLTGNSNQNNVIYTWYKNGVLETTGATYSANSSGTYTVVATNNTTCSSETSDPIEVTEIAVDNIIREGLTTSFCAGSSTVLHALTGTGYNYIWYRDGVVIPLEILSELTVTTAGEYTVALITPGCTFISAVTTVTTTPLPDANITVVGSTTFCEGQSVVLRASDGESWLWNTGATTQDITVTSPGDYTVTVTNIFECSATSAITTVIVNPLPATPTITSSRTPATDGNVNLCAGETVRLTASAGSSYLWSNGSTNQFIDVSTTGNYTVQVFNENNCFSTSAATSVIVNALPEATISASRSTTLCAGEVVTLTASGGASWLWSNGVTTQSIIVSTPGDYSVTVTNSNGCSSNSAATSVIVNTLPEKPIITVTGATTFCAGETVTLTAPESTSYLWSNGATTREITVSTGGNYSVRVGNTNGCLSVSSDAVPVVVNALPDTPTITSSRTPATDGNVNICAGETVRLTASAGSSYLWSNGSTNQFIDVSTPGNYTVQVYNANGCFSTSAATPVKVNALPEASISANGPTTFCQGGSVRLTASAGNSWLWSNGATTQFINVNASGTFTVRVTNSIGCFAISGSVSVTVNPNPTLTITNPAALCTPGTVNLTASAITTGSNLQGGSLSYWTDAAATVSLSNPAAVATSGTYYIKVQTTGGCVDIKPVTVIINQSPTVDFTLPKLTFFTGEGNTTLTPSVNGVVVANNVGTFTVRNFGAQPTDIIAGAIVNRDQFSPCAAGAGTKIIRYTYSSANGCTAFTEKIVTITQSVYSVVVISNPKPFCRGVNVTHTAFVYRDAQIEYPYLVNAQGQAVRADGVTLIGPNELPIANQDFSKTQGATQAVKDNAFRFFDPIVTGGTEITSGLTYQWTKNQANEIGSDDKTFGNAGLSSLEYYAAYVTVNSSNACGPDFTSRLSTRAYTGALPDYEIVLSLAPNPICPGASVTLTATLDPQFQYWANSNLQVNWVVTRNGVATTFATSTYTGTTNLIQLTTSGPGGALGNFQNGDQISIVYSSDIDQFYGASKCGGDIVTNTVAMVVATTQTLTGGAYCAGSTGSISMGGSQIGISYQLLRDGTNVGSLVAGTGNAIIFDRLTFGNYTVQAIVSGNTCLTFGPVALTVNPLPIANAGDDQVKCAAGATTTFNPVNSSIVNGTAIWTVVSGNATITNATSANPTITVTGTGTATIRLTTNSNTTPGCGSVSDLVVLTVNPLPIANAGNDQVKCAAGATTTFNPVNSSIVNGTAIWTVVSGNATITNATSANPTITVTGTGTATIQLTTNSNTTPGCGSVSDLVVLTVNKQPSALSVIGGGNYCDSPGSTGRSITLKGSEPGITYQLFLSINNVTTLLQTVEGTGSDIPFGNFKESGNYLITASNTTAPSCQVSTTVPITRLALPVSQKITGASEYCPTTTPNGVTIGLVNSQPNTTYRLYRKNEDGSLINVILATKVIDATTTAGFNFDGLFKAGNYGITAAAHAGSSDGCINENAASVTITETQAITNLIIRPSIIEPNQVDIGKPAVYQVKQAENNTIAWTYEWVIIYSVATGFLEETQTEKSNKLTIASVRENMVGLVVNQVAPPNICPNTMRSSVIIDDVTPLPVELIYLKATKQEKNVVKVEWATATEKDNKGFEVQVSQDAKTYRTLSFVPTQDGNTLQQQVYTFYDKENGKNGTRYYRLKQVDMNGDSEYFGPKAVTMDDVSLTMTAYPNPFIDEVTLQFAAEETGDMLVELTTAAGAKVYEKKVKVQKGFNTQTLKLNSSLANGVYIITTHQGGKTNHIRLMKQQ